MTDFERPSRARENLSYSFKRLSTLIERYIRRAQAP